MQTKNPKVSCVIINYNGEKFIEKCLNSLSSQDYTNFEVIFIDNVSTDNSVKIVKEKFPNIKLIENKINSGYAGAANQAIEISDGKYLMILNPDIIYEKNYISLLVETMESNPKIGVITGKLLKYNFEKNEKTKLFDTTGLYCFRNRRIIDRGQGHEDRGQYDNEEEVFGVSGASPFYRREALLNIAIPLKNKKKEIFDEDFFMYKEDIDVSWRLLLFGWKAIYYPKVVAYHGRGTGVLKRANDMEVLKHRRKLSKFVRSISYKNQRLMQIKNEIWWSLLRDFLPFLKKEILALGYIILLEPYVLKSVVQFFKQLPNALHKRKWIMQNKKVDLQYIHHFLGRAKN